MNYDLLSLQKLYYGIEKINWRKVGYYFQLFKIVVLNDIMKIYITRIKLSSNKLDKKATYLAKPIITLFNTLN